ncbi:MAG: hypothetical protein AB1758_01300 [Candidatus Eremiobacterota bacterium]
MSRDERGTSLAATLAAVAGLMVMALVVVSLVVNHLRVAQRVGNGMQARNRAESLLALAVQRLLADPDYGRARGPQDTLRLPSEGGGTSVLTFNPDIARMEGMAWSSNNFSEQSSSAPGWQDRVVPASSVHLVAVGRFRGVERQVEAILGVPRYPYVVACEGRLRSNGGLLVAAVDPSAPLDGQPLAPGHLACNGADTVAVQLGPHSRITGDVRAPGGIHLAPDSVVEGSVRSPAPPVQIPRIPLSSYDPQAQGKPQVQVLTVPALQAPILEGYARSDGSLRIEGGLTLEGGVLFVDGDLDLSGGVRGTGCVVVTGRARLEGASGLSTDNVSALLVGGDLTLDGGVGADSSFRGLVYTEGRLLVRDTTLTGVLLAVGTDVELHNSALLQAPELSRVEFPLGGWPLTLWFGQDEGEDEDGEDGEEAEGEVAVDVQRAPDGTYAVRDPAEGVEFSGLTQAQAVARISEFVESHTGESLSQEEIDQVWARLGSLATPEAELPERVVVDPNNFLGIRDKARILLWRDLP